MSIRAGHVARELINRGSVIVMGDLPVTLRHGHCVSQSHELAYEVDNRNVNEVGVRVAEAADHLNYGWHENDVLSLSLHRGELRAMLYAYTDDYRMAKRLGGHVVSF